MVVVGPTPPPVHGVAVMTHRVLEALERIDRLAGHVDTSDRRPLSTIGRLDLVNVWLGLKHAAMLWRAAGHEDAAAVYLPISQTTWGFMRDATLVAVVKLRRKRLVLHLNGGHFRRFYEGANVLLRKVIEVVCRQADEAWALTPSLQDQYAGLVDGSKVRSVGNVVPDSLESDPAAPPGADGFKVLYLSNLLPEKGCFELMRSLRSLGAACGGWEVCVAGPATPDVERRLRREAEELAREGGAAVRFAGEVGGEAKAGWYRWADLFVFPTYYRLEGQPLVLLEAMAAGLPILSTRHAGVPETIRHEVEALLVEPRDADGLAAALSRLAADDALRTELGERARERYEAQYSPARLVDDLELALDGRAGR
jgi:glycosyltransferase involved in cell wall biosynthesis